MSAAGDDMGGLTKSSKSPSVAMVKMVSKVNNILSSLKKAENDRKKNKRDNADIDTYRAKLFKQIEILEELVNKPTTTDIDRQYLIGAIAKLQREIDEPNRPPQQELTQEQQTLRAEAEAIIQSWVDAGHGFDYETLDPQIKTLLQALIAPSGIHEMLAEILLRQDYNHLKNDESMYTLLESIKKLFLMKLAQSCIDSTGRIAIDDSNQNHLKYLKALARTCIDRILKSVTGGPSGLLALSMQAVRDDPTKVARDTISLGFASAVVRNCLPNSAGEAMAVLQSVSAPILQFMIQHPAETFVSAIWAGPQLKQLYEAAIRQMYPGVPQDTIPRLVDDMNEAFLQQQSTGLTGEAPLVIATLFDRIASLVYRFKSMCVRQCQFTGDAVRSAMAFPKFVFDMVNYGRLKLQQTSDKASVAMMERYGFVPDESIAGFNDGDTFEDSLMRILRDLETEGFNFEDVKPFIIRLFIHTKNSTIWEPNVEYLSAQSDMSAQFPPPAPGSSQEAVMGQDSLHDAMEEVSGGTFGTVPGAGEIPADMEWAANETEEKYANSLRAIRHHASTMSGLAAQHSHHRGNVVAAPQSRAAAHPFAQGGNQDPLPLSLDQSLNGLRRNANPAFDALPRASGGLGGRSRSRKRSVSKRTRRKGVAKKQKSNKNKRQSRRKVRRASSRKGRK